MKTIVVINFKGGVSKTTTASTLLAGLNKKNLKSIGIDLDSQCSFSFITGADYHGITVWEAMQGEEPVLKAIQHTGHGDVIAGSDDLSTAATDPLFTAHKPGTALKMVLEPIKEDYEYCVIDTPPDLGFMTVGALALADYAVVTCQADVLSIQGMSKLFDAINKIKARVNGKLKTAGILLTRYSPRSILSKDVKELIEKQARNNNTILFNSTIREYVAIKEAQISQQSIFDYEPSSNIAADYMAFIEELLAIINNQ